MSWQSKNPWRCWERMTLAGVLNGPEDLLMRVALFDRRSAVYQNEFRWPALVRLGPNDFGGRYAQVTLRFGQVHWSFECASEDQRTYLLVRCLDPAAAADVELRLETFFRRSDVGQVVTREEEIVTRCGLAAWRIWSPSPNAIRRGSTITASLARPFFAVIEPAPDFGHRLEQRTEAERRSAGIDAPLSAQERDVARRIASARAEYLSRFTRVPRELWWAYAAVPYGIGWNVIWASDLREPVEVCSRDWCVHGNYGDWVLFNWDTFLLVPAAADYDVELAHQIARPMLAFQTEQGQIPGIASPLGVSRDRSMPPVAALGFWKAYLRTGERSFVDEYYEALKRHFAWWEHNRDGNRDGLLEWGSNPGEPAHPQWQAHTDWAARYETGMDNHPMWDGVKFNFETCTQEQSDIGLSALHATSARCLAQMAKLRGAADDAEHYESQARALTARIEAKLWDDHAGLWLSRGWDDVWNHRASPCCFYPFFLPEVAAAHVDSAIARHLENPQRFGGRYAPPISPCDDPAYPEQYYVRGRIWPGQVLLTHFGLREARREDAAGRVAARCLATMRQEWLEEGHLHENYHAQTADGDDTPESDPLYSFGLMLPLTAWNHLHDVRIDGTPARGDLQALAEHLDADGTLLRQVDPLESLPALG